MPVAGFSVDAHDRPAVGERYRFHSTPKRDAIINKDLYTIMIKNMCTRVLHEEILIKSDPRNLYSSIMDNAGMHFCTFAYTVIKRSRF